MPICRVHATVGATGFPRKSAFILLLSPCCPWGCLLCNTTLLCMAHYTTIQTGAQLTNRGLSYGLSNMVTSARNWAIFSTLYPKFTGTVFELDRPFFLKIGPRRPTIDYLASAKFHCNRRLQSLVTCRGPLSVQIFLRFWTPVFTNVFPICQTTVSCSFFCLYAFEAHEHSLSNEISHDPIGAACSPFDSSEVLKKGWSCQGKGKNKATKWTGNRRKWIYFGQMWTGLIERSRLVCKTLHLGAGSLK